MVDQLGPAGDTRLYGDVCFSLDNEPKTHIKKVIYRRLNPKGAITCAVYKDLTSTELHIFCRINWKIVHGLDNHAGMSVITLMQRS